MAPHPIDPSPNNNDRLIQLADIAIADIDRVQASVGGASVALAQIDEQLTTSRIGLTALRDALADDRGDIRLGVELVVLIGLAMAAFVILAVVSW